jgi:putative ABC transport system permease protein
VTGLWRDIRFGFRLLGKNKGFAAVAILTLALGIGGNTAIFSAVYATLLAPPPYPHPEQLVVVWSKINDHRNGVSAGDYLDWKSQSTSFQELTAVTGWNFNISSSSEPENVIGARVAPGFITKTFGMMPTLGRDFTPEEGELGREHEVILSHRLWLRRFGGDRNVIGQQVRMDGETYTVVGVLPSGVYDRYGFQLWVPLAFKPEQLNHDFHWLVIEGRLKPGVSIAQAQAEMDAVARHIADTYPKSNKSWGATVERFQNDFLNRNTQQGLWLLMGAVSLVLLIACANVANLLLARGLSRRKEIAVRATVGATPRELFRQFLAESFVLSFLGGIAGVAMGWALLKALVAATPPFTLPPEADVRLSLPVLGFAMGITALSGVLFGCVPALQAARLNLNQPLKEGGRTTTGSGRHRLGRALVVVEFGLALTLLGGAGLLIHSFWNMTHEDLGVRTDHVLTFTLPIPDNRFSQPAQMIAFYRELLTKIAALPGVFGVGVSTGKPVLYTGFGMPFSIAGQPTGDPSSRPGAGFQMVSPGYYQTFGIRIDRGRSFTEQDVAGGLPVAMVNENFVKKFLSGMDPLTKRVVVEQLIPGETRLGPPIEWQIVGVFYNVRFGGVDNRDDTAEIDIPFWQIPWPRASVAVRTAGDPSSISKSVAAIVHSMDPDVPMTEVKTMEQVVDQSLSGDRMASLLLVCFALTALLLAGMGIYGVMAFSVSQRTHEIGMRMTLGANPDRVLRLILKEGMTLALGGLLLGIAGAFLSQRIMRSQLHGIGAVDPASFFAVSVVMVFAALLACYIPARRATRVSPVVALRDG